LPVLAGTPGTGTPLSGSRPIHHQGERLPRRPASVTQQSAPQIIDIRDRIPHAHPENAQRRALSEIRTGIWHYDAVHAPDAYDPVERYIAQARYHIGKVWGYDERRQPLYGFTLMYHYRVSRDGRIWWVNNPELMTWQARGANHRGLGLCADLGEGQEPTPEQVASMRALSDWLSYERPDIPNLLRPNWYGHCELRADGNVTLCPGRLLAHVQAYRAGASVRPGQRFFPETGMTVEGRFLQFWDDLRTRALPLLGYPISPEGNYRLEDGNVYLCQYFERARMELHGDQIMLGRLGAEVYEGLGVRS
jgi:N-acetylmuramoyl-L-alanine amidase